MSTNKAPPMHEWNILLLSGLLSHSIYRCKCLFNEGVDEVVDGFKKILFYCRLSLFGFAEYFELFRERALDSSDRNGTRFSVSSDSRVTI